MTTTLLITDLTNAKNDPNNAMIESEIDKIINLAKNCEYHDFYTRHATPKILLVEELKKLGLNDLVTKTTDGDYDDDYDQ